MGETVENHTESLDAKPPVTPETQIKPPTNTSDATTAQCNGEATTKKIFNRGPGITGPSRRTQRKAVVCKTLDEILMEPWFYKKDSVWQLVKCC